MNFENIKSAVANAAKAAGVDVYELYYMSSSEVAVGTLNKEVNSFSSSLSGGLCLRVLLDGKMGYASTELLTEEEMSSLVERAIDNARAVEKLDTVGIFGGSESYEESRLPQYTPMSAGELRSMAVNIGEELFGRSEKVKDGTTSQTVSGGFDIRIYNSCGLDLSCSCGVNLLVGEAVVRDGDEDQADYSVKEYKGDDGIICELVDDAVHGAIAKLGAGLVPSGKYNVIIDGKQMRSLLSVFSSAFCAKQVIDGMSPLKGKEGQTIAASIINLTDDPQREGNAVGTTFDAEGVATHRRSVIEGGVLKTFLHNRETALAMGKETTANASKASYSSPIGVRPHSFCIEPGADSFDTLLGKAGDGIYITEIKGLHAGANPVTGDFSLESEGFMIRDGSVAEAVKSFTVAGNFFDLLKSISAVGDKLERGVQTGFTGFGSPAVLIPDMSVAGE